MKIKFAGLEEEENIERSPKEIGVNGREAGWDEEDSEKRLEAEQQLEEKHESWKFDPRTELKGREHTSKTYGGEKW